MQVRTLRSPPHELGVPVCVILRALEPKGTPPPFQIQVRKPFSEWAKVSRNENRTPKDPPSISCHSTSAPVLHIRLHRPLVGFVDLRGVRGDQFVWAGDPMLRAEVQHLLPPWPRRLGKLGQNLKSNGIGSDQEMDVRERKPRTYPSC